MNSPAREGHHAWKLKLVAFVGIGSAYWLPVLLKVIVMLTCTVAYCIGEFRAYAHSKGPCGRCESQVPKNGAVEAYELAPALAAFHFLVRLRFLAVMCVLCVAAFFMPGPWGDGIFSAAAFAVAAKVMLERLHLPVRPWCPRCNDHGGGGGGHDDLVDAPMPTAPQAR